MILNIETLDAFITTNYEGDYRNFARDIGVNSVTVWRILGKKSNPGEKFLTNLMAYCKQRGYDIEYFFKVCVAQKK